MDQKTIGLITRWFESPLCRNLADGLLLGFLDLSRGTACTALVSEACFASGRRSKWPLARGRSGARKGDGALTVRVALSAAGARGGVAFRRGLLQGVLSVLSRVLAEFGRA